MADFENIKVDGLKELADALRELPQRIARNVLRGAVNAGATVIRQEAKIQAPIYHGEVAQGHPPPGTLKRALYQKQIRERSSLFEQMFYVGVRHGKDRQSVGKKQVNLDAYYWRWVEFGHYAGGSRKIPRKPGARAAAIAGGGANFVPAQPFLRPAFESRKDEAIQRIKDYLEERIPREAEALGR